MRLTFIKIFYLSQYTCTYLLNPVRQQYHVFISYLAQYVTQKQNKLRLQTQSL